MMLFMTEGIGVEQHISRDYGENLDRCGRLEEGKALIQEAIDHLALQKHPELRYAQEAMRDVLELEGKAKGGAGEGRASGSESAPGPAKVRLLRACRQALRWVYVYMLLRRGVPKKGLQGSQEDLQGAAGRPGTSERDYFL